MELPSRVTGGLAPAPSTNLVVVQNWLEELKQLARSATGRRRANGCRVSAACMISRPSRRQGGNMCDQDHFEHDRQDYEARGAVTRRQFGVLLGAGMAMMLPKVMNAVAVTES